MSLSQTLLSSLYLSLSVSLSLFVLATDQELRQSFVDMGYIRNVLTSINPTVLTDPLAPSIELMAPRNGPSELEFRYLQHKQLWRTNYFYFILRAEFFFILFILNLFFSKRFLSFLFNIFTVISFTIFESFYFILCIIIISLLFLFLFPLSFLPVVFIFAFTFFSIIFLTLFIRLFSFFCSPEM